MILRQILMLIFLTPLLIHAQDFDFRRAIDPFPIVGENSEQFAAPFLGGFNAPRPQFVDIDGDGDLDLFVQEQSRTNTRAGQLMFFENTGSSTEFNFEWRTDWYKNIDVGNWYKFADMDNDGDFDLFTESEFTRIRYYRNDGGATNADFTALADTLRDLSGEEIFFDLNSLPDLSDIDCDGDLDFFLGRQTGRVTFYENTGLSAEGIPQFQFVTDFFEEIEIIGEITGTQQKSQTSIQNHGANSLTLIDIDDDGVQDMFWGDFNERSIVYLRNDGSCPAPQIIITSRQFPEEDPVLTGGFNVPRFGDIDGDGDRDLFVGVLGGTHSLTGHLAENFIFYENTGPAGQPVFNRITTRFISSLDIGANSIPELADIDNDGDPDLFIGNDQNPETGLFGQIVFYENVGDAVTPSFQLADTSFIEPGFGTNYAPRFVDIDGDTDLDLFIGLWDGQLAFSQNNGSPEAWDFGTPVRFFSGIDVGNNNIPAFVDIDADGDLDLFMGEFFGNINFYENRPDPSSPDLPRFFREAENYFDIGVDVNFGTVDTLHSSPVFHDVDGDDDFDLFVGFESGEVFFYRNSGTPQEADFEFETTLDLAIKGRATPALADIDADGDPDFFAGESKGGLVYYENRSSVEDETQTIPEAFALLQNYPNPFNPETTISFKLPQKAEVRLDIFNLLGQRIRTLVNSTRTAGTHEIRWNGTDDSGQSVPSGIYLFRIKAGDFSSVRRMLLLK